MKTRRLFQALKVVCTLAAMIFIYIIAVKAETSAIRLEIGNRFEFPEGDWTTVLNQDFSYDFTFQLETQLGEVIDARHVALTGSKLFSIARGGSFHAQSIALVIPSELFEHLRDNENGIFYVRETVTQGAEHAWKLSQPLVVMVDRLGRIKLSADMFTHQYVGGQAKKASDTVEQSLVELETEEIPLGLPSYSTTGQRNAIIVFAMILAAIIVVASRFMVLLSQREKKARHKRR